MACWPTTRRARRASSPGCATDAALRARLAAGALDDARSSRGRAPPPGPCDDPGRRGPRGRPARCGAGHSAPRTTCRRSLRASVPVAVLAPSTIFVRCSSPTPGRSAPTPRPTSTSTPPAARRAWSMLGLQHRDGHGHPPEHRLPVADGALLLAGRRNSVCRTGSPNGCGSARSCSSPARGPVPAADACARTRPHVTAARFCYALTPYVLTLGAAAVGDPAAVRRAPLAARADDPSLATARWREPALFALVVAAIGSVNATALLLVGIAPCCGSPYGCWSTGRCGSRGRWATVAASGCSPPAARCGGWPACGPRAATASRSCATPRRPQTVATASLSLEVLRGLGYWFFYGERPLRPVDRTRRGPTRSGSG